MSNNFSSTGPDTDPQRRFRAGLLYGLVAYTIWGLLPLYFIWLIPASPFEIVSLRVIFSLVLCVLLLVVTRGGHDVRRLLSDRRAVIALAVAGVLIFGNWFLYTVATTTGHTLDASLGYFINPLVAILLGVIVMGEKLRPLQWAAVALGAVAVVIMSVFYGAVPWLGLGLAFTFGFYGLVKSMAGGRHSALVTLTGETAAITPIAMVIVWLVARSGEMTLTTEGTGHMWLMISSGVITAVPLLLFGAAASRLPLSTVGMLQYMAPIGQFLIAVFVLHEAMPPERWAGFVIVWIAVALMVLDAVWAPKAAKRRRQLER